jgi:hypothetical protein
MKLIRNTVLTVSLLHLLSSSRRVGIDHWCIFQSYGKGNTVICTLVSSSKKEIAAIHELLSTE